MEFLFYSLASVELFLLMYNFTPLINQYLASRAFRDAMFWVNGQGVNMPIMVELGSYTVFVSGMAMLVRFVSQSYKLRTMTKEGQTYKVLNRAELDNKFECGVCQGTFYKDDIVRVPIFGGKEGGKVKFFCPRGHRVLEDVLPDYKPEPVPDYVRTANVSKQLADEISKIETPKQEVQKIESSPDTSPATQVKTPKMVRCDTIVDGKECGWEGKAGKNPERVLAIHRGRKHKEKITLPS